MGGSSSEEDSREDDSFDAFQEKSEEAEVAAAVAAVEEAEVAAAVAAVEEAAAVDSIIFPAKGDEAAKEVQVGDAVDPITQAIRDEILTKQQLLLQKELANGMEEAEAKGFLKQDLTAIRSYLQSSEGVKAVGEVMKNPALQKQMHAIERDGYKAVHSKFEKSFHDVGWEKGASKVRTTDVTDADGRPVCTLTETTIDTDPQTVTLADGSTQTINNFRKIDFPKKLTSGNGPMHVSMAVQDADGHNISEKEAVYFTAHYDDSGKLTEVSSPTPVHFAGDGDDAIGYIEVEGKVFTLPVTREKYQEMMKEVARDNGLEEELATDQVVVQEKDQEALLAVEEGAVEIEAESEEVEEAEKTEVQKLADKMRESRGDNIKAEPKSVSGKAAVNAITDKVAEDIEKPAPEKSEAVKLAEKMTESRVERGNGAAEPELLGGGKAVSHLTKSLKAVARGEVSAATGKPVSPAARRASFSVRENLESVRDSNAQPKATGRARSASVPAPKSQSQGR